MTSRCKIELIEYDDQTPGSAEKTAIQTHQRLATQDEVDFIVTPYFDRHQCRPTAPMIAQYGYPHITTSAATDGVAEFAERWPNSFWMLGTATQLAEGAVQTLTKLRDNGDIGDHRCAGPRRGCFRSANSSTPPRARSTKPASKSSMRPPTRSARRTLRQSSSGAAAANPDSFVAFSYPGDTFALTEQGANPGPRCRRILTRASAPPSRLMSGRFGAAAEGVLGIGGINVEDPKHRRLHRTPQRGGGCRP